MRIALLFTLSLFWGNSFVHAQNKLINNGATIKVTPGTTLRVDNAGIDNKNAGLIDNQGNIYLDENFNQTTAANYNGGASSWLWFEGLTNQSILGDAILNVARLRVDNGNRLVFGQHVNVSLRVDLMNNGMIELGNFNLIAGPAATITGYDASHYIMTNALGYLQQEVGAAAKVFPIGKSIYNPATLTNVGVVDNFQARVEDFVLDAYPSGSVETIGMVGKAWFINEELPGGSDVSMTLQWNTSDELPSFDRGISGISYWVSSAWNRSPTWIAASNVGGSSWTQNRSGVTTFGVFAVEDIDLDLPIELLSFTAVRKTNDLVELHWSTASESNNKGFYVERMFENETDFSSVGWIDGAGSSTEVSNYLLEDQNPYTGISYYRLRQVDFDGTETLSEVKAVQGAGISDINNVAIYPNPVRDKLFVRFGNLPQNVQSAEFIIIDVQGRILFNVSNSVHAHQILSFDALEDLPAGAYLLQIRLDNGTRMSEKLIKKD